MGRMQEAKKMVQYKTGRKVDSKLVKRMEKLEEVMKPEMISPQDLEKKRKAE